MKTIRYLLAIIILFGLPVPMFLINKQWILLMRIMAFSDINLVKAYLGTCYSQMGDRMMMVCSVCIGYAYFRNR